MRDGYNTFTSAADCSYYCHTNCCFLPPMAQTIDRESEQRNPAFPFIALPPILPQFSLPSLDNGPQDPITRSPHLWTTSDTDLRHSSEALFSRDELPSHRGREDGQARLWSQALIYPRSLCQIMSWDGNPPPRISGILKMPFLTEQPPQQFGFIQQQ